MGKLDGKTAVITGGSRGIGREIALKLAGEGADIAILYIGDSQEAQDTLAKVQGLGVKAGIWVCDVSSLEQTDKTVKDVIETLGAVDILINNAGIKRDKLISSMSEADYDAVLDINLKGSFNMIKSCYKNFIRKRSGKIVNISSIAGIMGNAGQTNYSSSKAGLIGLTKSVARELAGRNINCNAVAPGFIETAMTKEITQDNQLLVNVPMKRMGTAKDIANAVAFLVSDDANYITGEVLRIDGGLAM